jgi:hypothetical protein
MVDLPPFAGEPGFLLSGPVSDRWLSPTGSRRRPGSIAREKARFPVATHRHNERVDRALRSGNQRLIPNRLPAVTRRRATFRRAVSDKAIGAGSGA